jgi:ubiquinone/menaquinone biosynthesis C-methylase UbiE
MPEFDPARYKQTQHDQWNKDGAAWHRWGATLETWFADVTATMIDLGRISPGDRVLDIAAGAGEPALSAAERVGVSGYVLATDLSENIIAFARQTADQRGIRNLETRVMDGEDPDLPGDSFDAILCRYGLMYMPSRHRALSGWHRVLKPGGRVIVAVYSAPEKNDWGSTPLSVIRRRAQLPPPVPGQPGPFSLGAAGVLQGALDQAGFSNVVTRVVSTPLRMPSARDCIRFQRESFGGFNQMMAHLSTQERESIWDEVEEAMRRYEGPDGFIAPCESIVAVGYKL